MGASSKMTFPSANMVLSQNVKIALYSPTALHCTVDCTAPNSLALNASAAVLESKGQSLDAYNYDNKAIADIIQDQMENVKFNGISVIYT
jgi:hypothetical protein